MNFSVQIYQLRQKQQRPSSPQVRKSQYTAKTDIVLCCGFAGSRGFGHKSNSTNDVRAGAGSVVVCGANDW